MATTDLPPDRNNGDVLVLITWILFGISTVLIIGRGVSKHWILRRSGPDDLLMLLAWICTGVYSVTVQLSYIHGLGRHYEYLSLQQDIEALRWVYIGQGICLMALVLGRASFVLHLLSIMGRSRPMLRLCLWITMALNVAFNVAFIGALYGKCGTTLARIINPTLTCYRPSPLSRFGQFVGSYNSATDAVFTIAPVVLITQLNTTKTAKFGAIALLGLSSFAMAAAIWRTITIDIIFSTELDFTWLIIPYYAASSLEQNTIIITASIPTLGPIVKYLRRKWRDEYSNASTLASGRKQSSDSDELYRNLTLQLGMRVPHLGNHVTIVAGSQARDSEERILPLQSLSTIKTTVKTTVNVEEHDMPLPVYSR